MSEQSLNSEFIFEYEILFGLVFVGDLDYFYDVLLTFDLGNVLYSENALVDLEFKLASVYLLAL